MTESQPTQEPTELQLLEGYLNNLDKSIKLRSDMDWMNAAEFEKQLLKVAMKSKVKIANL